MLKAKYFPGTSIWTATVTPPKSAFWASVLKFLPKLKDNAFYQLTEGNISLWSTPLCNLWCSIHDYLIPQQSGFVYPSLVKDLWLPDHKCWNHHLVFSLFQQPLPSHIVNTEIIDDDGFDFLCCPLAPNGICTTKSAYKLCLQELYTQPSNAPLDVSYDLKFFLKIN